MKIPEKGMDKAKLFETLKGYRTNDLASKGGRTWAYVYDTGRAEIDEVAKEAYTAFLSENGLDPTVFPSLLRLENEIVAMARTHLNGDENVVGNFTSGGTESIILAVKAARDRARAERPEIREPEMILPVTAHAAFHKAAHYLDVKTVMTPVDPVTFKADPEAVEKAVTDNTVLIVGSAVSYAHGVIDPIEDLGRIALDNDVLLHVDGCVGAFLLPYFKRLGSDVPPYDFSAPGVTSISMDFHKYAYAPKGASIVLYRDRSIRKYQLYACSSWTGYTVINTAVQSSKTGGPLAAAWAVLNFIGDDGYLEIARDSLEATRKLIDGISRIPDLRILGTPQFCMVACASDTVNVFHVIDEMRDCGWYIQPQLEFPGSGSKENIHFSVTAISAKRVEAMLADLERCVKTAKGIETADIVGMIRQGLEGVDFSKIDDDDLKNMMKMAGIRPGGLPGRMAEINEILNALPPELRERVLIVYFNELFS